MLGALLAALGSVYLFSLGHGEIVAGLALVFTLGASVAVVRMVRRLKQEKTALQSQLTELERTERAQREGEARYRVLVDHSPDAVIVICDGKMVFVNPAATKLLAADRPEDLLGRTPAEVVHQDERAEVARRTREACEGKQALTAERRMVRLDGSSVLVESRAIPFLFEGKPAVQVTLRDITERRAVEKQLREAEVKYRSIFDNALEGIFQSTPEGFFISVNPAFARMLGFATPEELIRERSDITRQSYAEPARREEFKRILERDGVVSDFEFEVKRKDGSTIWISENVRLVRAVSGRAAYYEGTAQDITERKRSEEALLRSVERFRSFTKATSQIVWQTDPAGRVVEDLPNWRAYTGKATEEILGSGWIDSLHPEDRERALLYWAECRAQKRLYETEYRMRGADGVYRLFSVRGVPVFDADGAVREWVGTNTDITERKRAEEVLRESEQRLRLLNDLSEASRALNQPQEILAKVVDLLGAHLGASRCSYSEVEADGDHFVIPHDYTDGCASIVGRFRLSQFGESTRAKIVTGRTLVLRNVANEITAAEGADAFEALDIAAVIACPLLKKGKLIATMSVQQTEPRQWTQGEIALVKEVAGRCRAIVERASAELVLRQSEEHLRLVIAASNDGIWEHDFVSGKLRCSDRMYEMLGLDSQSAAPTVEALAALLHPEDRAAFRKAMTEPENTLGRFEAHTRIRLPDGNYGHFLFRGSAVLDTAGRPIGVVGSIADLTNMLRAEQKLIEQANLLNLAHDAIMVRDMKGRVEFWNHGAEILYGWSATEAGGRLSSDFLECEEPVDLLAAQCTLLETGAWSGECRHSTKDGEPVVVRSRWSLLRDEEGKPKSTLVINTDITEQKKIEEQFLRAQRLESLGTLASGVAHDLNNILLPIMMAAPVLRGEEDLAERERFLDIVESSAQRGAEIIKQVLTFARGADGDHILLQPIYLLQEVSNIASQTFPKSISLRTSYEEDIRLIEADSTQLHQVLLNLCINARDAMPNGGELCLAVENFDVDAHYASTMPGATAGPHVMLHVSDTGSGISSEVIDKIFDPFFTTKSVGAGTGLGLSTAAGIVRSHGGFIRVASKPGRTSFKIFLPAKDAAAASHPLETETSAPRGRGQTILVVDDEPSIREVAEVILTNHGYHVFTAEDGPTALAIFVQQIGHIDIVLTDIAMPLMGGLALVRALRRIEPGVKIIVSTGRSDHAELAEFAELKVEGFLPKPYTTRNLLLKLSHVLRGALRDAA